MANKPDSDQSPQADPPDYSDASLARTLQLLRYELQLAKQQSAGVDMLFEIDKVEVEFKVIITDKTKGKAGLEFYVVKAGGEIENGVENTHTIKLTLNAVDPKGNRQRVSEPTSPTKPPSEN
jgi:hypothetical protein